MCRLRGVLSLLKEGKLPYLSIESFDACIAANGSCRCFGWDGSDATTFKVPKLNDVYIEVGTAASAGEFISGSIPNHGHLAFATDSATSSDGASNLTSETIASRCTKTGGYGSAIIGGVTSVSGWAGITSGIIGSNAYNDEGKVRPDSVRYRAMVQIANGASNEALVTCTSVLSDVASLKDANNFTSTGKSNISSLAMPSDKYIDLTLGATGTSYTAPANGWFSLWLKDGTASQGTITLRNNATKFGFGYGCTQNLSGYTNLSLPVSTGQSITIFYLNTTASNYQFRFFFAYGE